MDSSMKGQSFALRDQDASFKARQESVFGSLLPPSTNSTKSNQREEHSAREDRLNSEERDRDKSNIRQYKGEESIFKKPTEKFPFQRRPHQKNRQRPRNTLPDYMTNPHKWKKYSLDTVSESDMSEKSNSAAAFSFLREIEERKRKENPEVPESESRENSKVVFKRPKLDTSGDDKTNTAFQKSKVVMPTYNIGVKKSKKTKGLTKEKSEENKGTKKQMALSHLEEPEEELE